MKSAVKMLATIVFVGVVSLITAQANAAQFEEVIYYHNDVLGSPILATDPNGQVIWREEYSPYGSRLLHESRETDCSAGPCVPVESSWDEKQWYSGKLEETANGILFYGARWYEPEIGRFLSVDPVGFQENNVFSFNRYSYANNNPYRYTDPDGNAVETAWDVFNIGLGITSLSVNLVSGNIGGAALDAVGIVADTAAALTPFVPGGAGSYIRAGRVTKKGFHATHPDAAKAILEGGFRPGTKSGRLGSGGTYVNNKPEGAIAEFVHHNPGIIPTVLKVEYRPGTNASASVAPRKYVDQFPLNVESISAPSIRAPGTTNTNVLNGSVRATEILP